MKKRFVLLLALSIILFMGTSLAIPTADPDIGGGTLIGGGGGTGGFDPKHDNSSNTNVGNDVNVNLINQYGTTPLILTFETVTGKGNTTFSLEEAGPDVASNFKVAQFYEINTTAQFIGTITIKFNYAGTIYENDTNIRLLHFENGQWVDCTTSIDTENKIVYGLVSSLSPFALVKTVAQGTNTIVNEAMVSDESTMPAVVIAAQKVQAKNVGMQETGMPLGWALVSLLLILVGSVGALRR